MKRVLLILALVVSFAACSTAPPDAPAVVAPTPAPTPTPDPNAFRATAPDPLPPRPYSFPDVTRVTLDNGLRVLVAENHGAPLVTIRAVVRSGADQNPSGDAGLAAFTADMLDEGAGNRSGVQIAEATGDLGGTLTTGSDWDASFVNLDLLSRSLDDGLKLVSDVLVRPTFPQKELDRVRSERITAIIQQRDNASALANDRFNSVVYRGTPYGNPLAGTESSVRGISRRELNDFYRKVYVPNNVSLIITGDIDTAQATQLARRYFSSWQKGRDIAPASVTPQAIGGNAIYIIDRPSAVQSEIRVGHVGAARASEDYFALHTLNTILGGMFTSRINLNLREKHGYTYGARSSMGFRRSAGPFVVATPVRNEVTLPAVQEIMNELRAIRTGAVTDQELNVARNYLMGVFPATVESASDLADRLVELELYGLPEDYFSSYRERIAQVDADDIQRAANQYLNPDRSVILVVGKAADIQQPLSGLGYAVTRLDVEGNPATQ
jgi:zinc protease